MKPSSLIRFHRCSLLAQALPLATVGFALVLVGFVLVDPIGAADVTIDARTVYQRMEGFGSSERVFDDPHVFNNFNPTTARALTVLTPAQQDEVLDRLYVDLQLTRVRPASPETVVGVGVEPQNDNADPTVIDGSRFNFAWKNLDAHADYIARLARSRQPAHDKAPDRFVPVA